jgi:SAM-dependent methyltransferase
MSDWTSGYVAELEYSQGVYREMAPGLLRLNLLLKQADASALSGTPPSTPLRYAELGCGHGLTATMIAASHPGAEVHATDFNPAHVAGAIRLAVQANLKNIHFYEHSFAEFLTADLPMFDVVALHGVYSWISDENRALIRDFLYAKLKPGGICYISYNVLPGWAPAMPMRKLMIELGEGNKAQPMAARIDGALEFLGKMQKANAGYFKANPMAATRLEGMQKHSRNYLAHEYMNRDWTLFYHCDVARELAGAKLTFAASAHAGDHVDIVNLTVDQQQLLAGVSDPAVRETVRDFLVNQQFRRDIFAKGLLRLSAQEQVQALANTRFALTVPRSSLALKATFPVGEVNLQAEVYEPVADALAEKPKSVAEMLASEPLKAMGYQKILQALVILTSSGQAAPALDDKAAREAKPHCDRLNAVLMERARTSADIAYLVSPVIGSGVPVDRFTQLMLLGRKLGQKDIAAFVWSVLSAQNQRILKDGKTLETPEENLAELKTREADFTAKTLPLLTSLGIA